MNQYYWSGISHDERYKALRDIHAVIDKHATILDFRRFSDISLSLVLELDGSDPRDLKTELSTIVLLDDTVEDKLPGKNAIIYLNIAFVQGTGNLCIEVPNVPG